MTNDQSIIARLEDGKKLLRYIGVCIYCGSDIDLSDEHIIPLSLNGTLLLGDASCRTCARITSAFEGAVARVHLSQVRAGLEMKSRRSKDRPKSFPLNLGKEGGKSEIEIKVEDQPTLLSMPIFDLPSVRQPRQGIATGKEPFIAQVAGPEMDEFMSTLNAGGTVSVDYKFVIEPVSFARLLAKIAYATAVGIFGNGRLTEVYCLPAILGQVDDVGRWVGTVEPAHERLNKGRFHETEILRQGDEITGRIKLFAFAKTPEYVVAIGRASPELVAELSSPD